MSIYLQVPSYARLSILRLAFKLLLHSEEEVDNRTNTRSICSKGRIEELTEGMNSNDFHGQGNNT